MPVRGVSTIALLAAVVFSGCSAFSPRPERTRFVLLAPATPAGPSLSSLAIGLGPVQLPQYLDRPELVIRTSPNSFDLSDTDRWAEPLADNFRSVLASDLRTQLGTSNIVQYPWYAGTRLDYVVRIQVEQFDADKTGTAELVTRWDLRTPKNDQVLASHESQFSHPANSRGGDAVAAALSADLAELGEQIASAIAQARTVRMRTVPGWDRDDSLERLSHHYLFTLSCAEVACSSGSWKAGSLCSTGRIFSANSLKLRSSFG